MPLSIKRWQKRYLKESDITQTNNVNDHNDINNNKNNNDNNSNNNNTQYFFLENKPTNRRHACALCHGELS